MKKCLLTGKPINQGDKVALFFLYKNKDYIPKNHSYEEDFLSWINLPFIVGNYDKKNYLTNIEDLDPVKHALAVKNQSVGLKYSIYYPNHKNDINLKSLLMPLEIEQEFSNRKLEYALVNYDDFIIIIESFFNSNEDIKKIIDNSLKEISNIIHNKEINNVIGKIDLDQKLLNIIKEFTLNNDLILNCISAIPYLDDQNPIPNFFYSLIFRYYLYINKKMWIEETNISKNPFKKIISSFI